MFWKYEQILHILSTLIIIKEQKFLPKSHILWRKITHKRFNLNFTMYNVWGFCWFTIWASLKFYHKGRKGGLMIYTTVWDLFKILPYRHKGLINIIQYVMWVFFNSFHTWVLFKFYHVGHVGAYKNCVFWLFPLSNHSL